MEAKLRSVLSPRICDGFEPLALAEDSAPSHATSPRFRRYVYGDWIVLAFWVGIILWALITGNL
jgi:hypothetical protein